MVTISRSALVNHSAQNMFDLINDIEAYPQYMTGCLGAKVIERKPDVVEAQLILGKSGFQQQLVTRNELQPPSLMIMRFVDGPFSHFEGRWEFAALTDSACKVSLDLEFAFSSPILAMTVGKWFEKTAGEQVDALCKRADEIYQ